MKKISNLQNLVGWVGAISLVAAYTLLTFEVVSAQDVLFNGMQLLGGVCLAYRVYLDRNWSNLALEAFFVSVAVYALLKVVL